MRLLPLTVSVALPGEQILPLQGVENVLSLAEERDRRQQGTGAIRSRITRACRSDLSTDPWSRPDSVRA